MLLRHRLAMGAVPRPGAGAASRPRPRGACPCGRSADQRGVHGLRAVTAGSQDLIIVGLAGGIGAGKSTVARLLAEHGARVIDSDCLNREELRTPEVVDTLVRWFGDELRGPDGALRAENLAEVIFQDPQARTRVEGLLHPRIEARREALIEACRRDPSVRMVVLDSPLLYEAGLDRLCHAVIFVEAPDHLREERVARSRQWPDGELARREQSQNPLDSKRARADYRIVNNSGLDELRVRVEKLLPALWTPAPA